MNHYNLGRLEQRAARYPEARRWYNQALDTLRHLESTTNSTGQPPTREAQRDLAMTWDRLAEINLELKDVAATRAAYRNGLEVKQRLAEADPNNVQAQRDLATVLNQLGYLEQTAFEFPAARQWYDQARTVLLRLEQEGKLKDKTADVRWLREIERRAAVCEAVPRATDNLEFALRQPAELVPQVLYARAAVLARRGQLAAAAATVEKLADLTPKTSSCLYDAACGYALCAAAVAGGEPPGQLSPGAKVQREEYAARAVQLLRAAVRAGYDNVPHLRRDNDLDPLRDREDFRQLLRELEKK
jgi:tetratricopeptide (TPR) repeat protein